jgi:DNA repair protein NreA
LAIANEIKARLERNWIKFLNDNSAKFSVKTLSGATPPSVFVGRHGYPKVNAGPMMPPLHGDTTILDKPEMWPGKSLEEIVNYRLSLVRGVSKVNVHNVSEKYVESLQEVAMTNKSVESEATFEKVPITDFEQEKDSGLDTDSVSFGPVAPLKSFKTSSSISVDQRIEDVYHDKDLSAAQAIVNLYQDGVEVSTIHRVLSIGMLGLQKNRRLVPTRWSISATDDVISANLIKKIETFSTFDLFKVYKYAHLGNYYSVILIPDEIWSFEMQEAWYDNNSGNMQVGVDFENANGLDHYPSIAGAYFAARLGVAEYLFKVRRKAAALILREIHPEYVMPVGVWQIREGIRRAFEGEGEQIENFEEALSFACINLSLSKNEWKRKSEMYRSRREQLRITDFFRNNNDIRMARDTS